MHYQQLKDIFKELNSSENGLSEKEAEEKLQKYGLNEIKEAKKIFPLKIFISQFKSFMIYILVGALAISLAVGEKIDAIVIGVILILNAILGFVQEYRAEKSIEALKKLASLKATVIRDGKEREIDAKELVIGDVIKLSTGNKIPADSRLIEIANLQTQEAALTGESLPVKKEIIVLAEKTQTADRKNMVFSGTIITAGKGKAIVTETGMKTEIGKIAELIEDVKPEPTHLQIKLEQLGKFLGILVIIIAAIVFISGTLFQHINIFEMLMVTIALAVAAIPEGLPAVVTIGLALGVQRMIKRNALIRKLPSVETLGATTSICSDKTGTLTRNEMTVRKIYANGKIIEVTGSGYETKGEFLFENKKINKDEIELLLRVGALNNDASLAKDGIIGDPTEAALIVSAAKAGLIKEALEEKYKKIDEIPFSSERKCMTTMHKFKGETFAFMKGAPEVVLKQCNAIYENGEVKDLTEKNREEILEINKEFANNALRVLGFAYKTILDKERAEKNLIFVGLQGMIDPSRTEVIDSIKKCKAAGIKVVMITGDHEITAKAIAREIGLEGKSLTGADLDKITNLEEIVEDIVIYARVNPEHKIKIVDALKKKGHIVAMTGDGVNDAPALKKADIGIAMGITGTDVAKEASAMILTDDNFSSIVNAVEEGRGIYDNIKKFVEYLLSSNLGEVLTIFTAILIGLPSPLIAIQILWVNLVTDGLPALALSEEPVEKDIMARKPRNPKETILSKQMITRMMIVSLIMMTGTLSLFKFYNPSFNLMYAQTIAFTTLMMFQMFNVLNCRSEHKSLFKIGPLKNKYLIMAITTSILLQLLVLYTPLNIFFKTIPLNLADWLLVFLVSSSVLWIMEILKLMRKFGIASK